MGEEVVVVDQMKNGVIIRTKRCEEHANDQTTSVGMSMSMSMSTIIMTTSSEHLKRAMMNPRRRGKTNDKTKLLCKSK